MVREAAIEVPKIEDTRFGAGNVVTMDEGPQPEHVCVCYCVCKSCDSTEDCSDELWWDMAGIYK